MNDYQRLQRQDKQPKRVSDHSRQWAELALLVETNGAAEQRVRAFCVDKRISFESLVTLGTRVVCDRHGAVVLAWGYESGGAITAVKHAPVDRG